MRGGFTEDDIGTTVYMTALTKCFRDACRQEHGPRAIAQRARQLPPVAGRAVGAGPAAVVILFGKMAIDTFLPRMSLEDAVGRTFELGGVTYVPLPHSSGASTWLNDAGHRALLAEAIQRVREMRVRVVGGRETSVASGLETAR